MKSIKRNFAYNILLNLSRVIFPLITAPYIARVLEPEGVGLFNFASTYANYFALFAVLGVPTYGIREISKKRDDRDSMEKLVSELMTISIFSTLIASVLFILSLFLIPQLTVNKTLFLVAGIILYLAPLRIDWYYSGLERFGYITARALIIRFLSLIAMFIFVKNRNDLLIYMLIYTLGTIGGDLWNLYILLKDGIKPRIKLSGLKKHISPLFVLFASTIAISIYTILDTLMLGFMTSYQEVGYYNSATHISKAILVIVTSLSAVAIPRVALYAKENNIEAVNALISKSCSIVSFLALPLTIGIICISPVFVPLFFGEAFRGAIIPLMIISGVIVAIGFNNLTGIQILIGMGYDKLFLRAVLAGSVLNLILNLIMIPFIGASGAAISSVCAESLILLITYIYIRRETEIRFVNIKSDIIKATCGSILFIPVSLGLNLITSGWLFVFADVLCCGILYILSQKLLNNSSFIQISEIILKTLRK